MKPTHRIRCVERESQFPDRFEELFIQFLRYAKPQFTPKAIEQRTHFINEPVAFGSCEDAE